MAKKFVILCCLTMLSLTSCGIYTFSGASIEPGTKTVFVDVFPNRAQIVAPILSQAFTEKLQDKFVNETNLELLNTEADLNFSGFISRYTVRPVASADNDIAELNRLTITVSVKYQNTINEDVWESSFSGYQDFEKSTNLKDIEDDLIDEICQQIADDIFIKALVNW